VSIFDPTSGMNALPWIQEKGLRTLEEAARLVDLANEKDTTPWYSKELRYRASTMIGCLAPMVALFHGSAEAARAEAWNGAIHRPEGAASRCDTEQLRSARFDRQARRMSTSLSTLAQPEKEKTSTDQDDGARFQVSFPAPNLL
jgi:hypothetical protein